MSTKHTPETIEKIRLSKLGDKNPMWKGDKVGYASLHEWVNIHLPRPDLCQMCKQKPPYDLANTGVYNRHFSNWEYLCRKCHMLRDGRLNRLIQFRRNLNVNSKLKFYEFRCRDCHADIRTKSMFLAVVKTCQKCWNKWKAG